MRRTVAYQAVSLRGSDREQLLGTTVGAIAHDDIAAAQQQMSEAFADMPGADAQPGQPSCQQVIGRVQAPGVCALVPAGDVRGVHQQDALGLHTKAAFGSGQQRIEEPVGTGQ